MKKIKIYALLLILSILSFGFYNIINLEIFEEFSLDSTGKIQEFDQTKVPKTSQNYQDPITHIYTTDTVKDVFISGDYAYLATSASGLAIIDISDPTNPGVPIYKSLSGNAFGVFVDGDFAYIAAENAGLAVINITDPTTPGDPVYESTPGTAQDVIIDGDYAFIADGGAGLTVIDVSDPNDPGTAINKSTLDYAHGISVDGDFAYIADGTAGLTAFGITDPMNPGALINRASSDCAWDVFVNGNYAYIADGGAGLSVIDISNPLDPGIPNSQSITDRSANRIFVEGDQAYIACNYNRLAIFDISQPSNSLEYVTQNLGNYTENVFVDGNYAYIGQIDGLAILEISTPITPEDPVYEDTLGNAYGIYVSGDYAYIADNYQGLAIINISDPTNPSTPISKDTVGGVLDLCISGNYAYLANREEGLVIIDISNPQSPGDPIYENTTGFAEDVFIKGNYAYIAVGGSGLAIIDISNPTNPGTPIYVDTAGFAWGVHISGNYAYIADGNGLAVINITDPVNPGSPIYRNTLGGAQDVFIKGNYAYIADDTEGLAVINITDPTNPGSAISMNTTGYARGIYVSGNFAYIADVDGLAIIDISNPMAPGSPTYKELLGRAWDIYISGDLAYISVEDFGIVVVKVRDLHSFKPSVVSDLSITENGHSRVTLEWTAPYIDDGLNNNIADYIVKYSTSPINEGNFDSARNFDVSHWNSFSPPGETQTCVISDLDDLVPDTQYYFAIESLDIEGDKSEISNVISQTTASSQIYQTPVIYESTFGTAFDVFVSGNYAFVADYTFGLAIIDVSDPINPGKPVYVSTTGDASAVYVSGDYAYVADYQSGLAIINISDPTNPGTPIYMDTSGIAWGIYVSGDYAYVADCDSGLAIINISDPSNPGTPVYMDTLGSTYSVYVSGDYAYVADMTSGLAIIDISDPTNPGTPVYMDTTGLANGVYVSGNYAYIADYTSGLAVIDISDPANPGTPIYEDTTGNAVGIYVSGDYAYVADKRSGLAIIDISDPINPGTPVYMDTSGSTYSVYVSGDYAFIADLEQGLAIIKISEIISSGDQFNIDTAGNAEDICISGDYAYLACGTAGGLAIIDINDPTNPGSPIYKDTSGQASDLFVSGDYAYIADGESGLAIIDISDPTNPGAPIYEDTLGYVEGIYIDGNYAYLANGDDGLAIIDISDPTNPGIPIYKNGFDHAYDVYVSGNYAYVADGDGGLTIYNITDPLNPGDPYNVNISETAESVFINGDYAYIACIRGVAAIDISDPTNPIFVDIEDTTGSAQDIFISGNYVFVADGDMGGLSVVNINEPKNPRSPFYLNTNNAKGVYVNGEYAYIADDTDGLTVIQIRQLYTFKPSQISNLNVCDEEDTYIKLWWEVPYIDDGLNNPISSYVVKYSTEPITDENFDSATNFNTFRWLTPLGPGEDEYVNVTGLNPNTHYYFAIKSIDEEGDYSEISNIINATTSVADKYGNFFSNLSLLEKILFSSGILLVIGAVVTIPIIRNKKKKKQKKEVGIAQEPTEIKTETKVESKAEAKAKAKAEKSRLSEEKIQKKRTEVKNELKGVKAQIQEGNYTQAIASLKTLQKTANKNKFLDDFKPEIDNKLKFCENSIHFRSEREKIERIYKSGKNFIGAYNNISNLKAEVDKFPKGSELIHPAVVLEVNETFQMLKGEYEERKANLISGISSISEISEPKEILNIESKFTALETEANALKMDYILPKISDQHIKYEKNLQIYNKLEELHQVFNQGDISKANFDNSKLIEEFEGIKRDLGEDYIYPVIALNFSNLSNQIQTEINERNTSLYDLNNHYETMFTPDQIRNAKELYSNILKDAETLGIKDLTEKIKHNLNICGVSIPFLEEKEKYLQIYSEGQLENAYVGLESLKNRIEVHPRPDLIAPDIKNDIENTYDDIYNEVKSTNAKIFGEIESIESLMKSEQISEAKKRLVQLQNESLQLGFKEVNNKINRMIQVCNVTLPILEGKNRYWAQYSNQNQLIPALDGLQNLADDINKGMQSDLILPSIVSDLREKLEYIKSKLDENRKEIEDKLKQISLTIDPENLSKVIEVMKKQSEIAQKLRFDDIEKRISENLIDFEDVSKIYGLFKRAKRLAITDISRKSEISRERLIDLMLDPEKGLEMLEIDGDFITIKQAQEKPKARISAIPTTEIKGTPFKAESEKITQNQELQILREYEYLSGQVRFKVGVINQSPGVLTNIKIDFTIPDALKWITYEPISYKRKGDSVIIPKLSLNEKKSLNLYLEPISCMSGPINAIVSYFNALDEPKAITMRPKVIGITCPIFFTEEEANLARVESLYRQLSHKDKKILPIQKDQDLHKIFNLLLKVGGSHQIKLVSKEFSAENKYGKILYYGLTKVKKQKMVIIFMLRGKEQTIEVDVAGDNEESITALLAEIQNQIRDIFTKEKIIKSGNKFHEMKTSVILGYCPFCGADFDRDQQEEFIKGKSITCEYCDKVIRFN
ncbi:MAG: fibronectin type III domain-containing protein [Promethearchaeota archaeon]